MFTEFAVCFDADIIVVVLSHQTESIFAARFEWKSKTIGLVVPNIVN